MQENLTALEAVLRRDRTIAVAGLAGVAALAWVYILYLAQTVRRRWLRRAIGWVG